MDESVLLDLLECPVCLERLDASAKVLPCQHTFCKRCLLGIVNSRNELRCPECRTLVDCNVDDLPNNILLVRLLDGIKQRPQKLINLMTCSNLLRAQTISTVANCSQKDLHSSQSVQQHRIQARSPPVRGVPQLPCAKALYNYDGKEPEDLKFNKGDIIILRRQVDENWYHGEVNGIHGFFPTNFVQIIKPLPQLPPQCKALYDFELKDKEADKDCLPFSKDDILTVIRRVDENWAEGVLADRIGIFPISYVEFNSTAKQLIEVDKPSIPSVDSGEGTSGTSHCNSVQKHTDVKKNTKKRHSFTSLTMSSKASQSSQNRHSMEISPPVLISSSNPTAAARITELSCSALSQSINPPLPPPPPPVLSATIIAPNSTCLSSGLVQKSTSALTEQISHLRAQTRPNVYIAIYPYTPRKEDELELRKGEMFLVFERCQDGWFKGTSMHTSKIGVFPGNYVASITRPVTSATQAKIPLSTDDQTGRVVTMVNASTAGGAVQKLHGNGMTVTSDTIPRAVVSAAHIQKSSQSKVIMHMSSQMAVNQSHNAVRTVAIHSEERPTATVTPIQTQNSACLIPATVIIPHHSIASQQLKPQFSNAAAYITAVTINRANVPLACTTSSLNSPSTSVSVDGDSNGKIETVPMGAPASPENTLIAGGTPTMSKTERDGKKEKKGLLKLLSGASTKCKLRASPPSSPTLEVELATTELSLQGAVGPEIPSISGQGRTDTYPMESESPTIVLESTHSKTSSLDSNIPVVPPPRQPCSSLAPVSNESRSVIYERYRVVVPYPPQSEAELELKEGDVVFVHKKHEDGWFKGTLQRNGKTGLFPGSFVESI
ncbi:E3 ubiquitin-protein ligase SH3RF1 isoform X1 [Erythrolamprus reginae]|uniref:E3 ubiquitin-protein ligase SH3RF1 isoform X1 n=1 Tax=Erythrolamprus reginae TaxID=121349 RepID=UPI00396CC3A3